MVLCALPLLYPSMTSMPFSFPLSSRSIEADSRFLHEFDKREPPPSAVFLDEAGSLCLTAPLPTSLLNEHCAVPCSLSAAL